jgi:hypothetical protein
MWAVVDIALLPEEKKKKKKKLPELNTPPLEIRVNNNIAYMEPGHEVGIELIDGFHFMRVELTNSTPKPMLFSSCLRL